MTGIVDRDALAREIRQRAAIVEEWRSLGLTGGRGLAAISRLGIHPPQLAGLSADEIVALRLRHIGRVKATTIAGIVASLPPRGEGAWRRYRKRPIIVQAYGPVAEPTPCQSRSGPIIAPAGNYIIREQDGDGEYPCAPDTFERTYDAAD